MDMLTFSGCTQGYNDEEMEELARMRYAYPWWKEKIINSDFKRKGGLCPLTPEETALTLRPLDIDRDIQFYIAAGELYGGKTRMDALQDAYQKLFATTIAASDMSPTLPIRLALALNFSVFYYKMLNSPERCTSSVAPDSEDP